jgi:hypothetical protein
MILAASALACKAYERNKASGLLRVFAATRSKPSFVRGRRPLLFMVVRVV